MSSPLFEILGQALGGGETPRDIGAKLGIEPSQAATAMSMAIPVLVSALNRNAASPQGRSSLENALDRDHDGSVLDDLGGFLGAGGGAGSGGGMGGAILGHILGSDRKQVENRIGQASGLDAATIGKLLVMVAPLVLAALSRANKQTPASTSITDILSGAAGQMGQAQGGGGDILSQILGSGAPQGGQSSGGDQGLGGLASIGASVLGGLLRGR